MREIHVGERYHHFKGKTVEVMALAKDSESLEELVIYRHVDEEQVWVRSKEMFLGKVDHQKYPDVAQDYRFELIEQ